MTRTFISIVASLGLLIVWLSAHAAEIQVLALTKDKAILSINGERRVLKTGQTSPEGVTLIDSNSAEAVVEVDGQQEIFPLGVVVTPITNKNGGSTGNPTVTLYADATGFFFADGKINNQPVRFLVDTGASAIAMSSATADRIRLDYSKGTPGIAQTASGIAQMVALKLNSVSVGGIELYNVDASVIIGAFPTEPLLGVSFLERLNMTRTGEKLELKKNY